MNSTGISSKRAIQFHKIYGLLFEQNIKYENVVCET